MLQRSWIFTQRSEKAGEHNHTYTQQHIQYTYAKWLPPNLNTSLFWTLNLIKLMKQEDSLTGENVELLPAMLTYSFHVVLWPIKENKVE